MALIKVKDIRHAFELLFKEYFPQYIDEYDARITENADDITSINEDLAALDGIVTDGFADLNSELYYTVAASEDIDQYQPVKYDGNPALVDGDILGFATHDETTGNDLVLKISGIYQAYVSESVVAGNSLSCAGDGTLVVADAGVVVATALEDITYVDTPLLCQIKIK